MASILPEPAPGRITTRQLVLFLAAVGAVNVVTSLPDFANARGYLLFDVGASLKADGLIRAGLRPYVDFPYNYGLLALAIQRLVVAVFGSSPWPQVALVGVLEVAVAALVGLAAARIGVARSAAVLLAVLMPHLLNSVDIVPSVHGLETTLLVFSLALWLRGGSVAAALAALAAGLVKPGMGLVLSVVLLAHAAWTAGSRAALWRRVGVYAVGAAVLVVPLILWFGPASFAGALVAADARRMYAAMQYGWPQLTRGFLAPPGANVRYFLGNPVALWLALLALVTGGAAWHLATVRGRAWPRGSFALLCAGIAWVWVLLAFGNGWSWSYYLFAMVLGSLAVLDALPRGSRRSATAALILLGLISYRTVLAPRVIGWRTERPAAEFRSLWADGALVAEWGEVRQAAARAPTIAVWGEGEPSAFASIRSAPYWMLLPGLDTPAIVRSLEIQIATSCFAVRQNEVPGAIYGWLPPAIVSQLGSFDVVFKGDVFTILRNPQCAEPLPGAL